MTKKGKTDPTGIPDGYSEEEEEADETIEADPMLKAKKPSNAAAKKPTAKNEGKGKGRGKKSAK